MEELSGGNIQFHSSPSCKGNSVAFASDLAKQTTEMGVTHSVADFIKRNGGGRGR